MFSRKIFDCRKCVSDLWLTTSRKCTTSTIIKRDEKYVAHNYHPIPAALCRGKGVHVWDVDGRQYLDFLSGYSALNQGHCHPKIVEALQKQAGVLHHTSRAVHNNQLGEFAEYATKLFGYDKILPMNGGVEGSETAVKIARKWGYKVKKIKPNCAKIIFCENNFWGRSLGAVSASTDPVAYENYGPFVPNFITIPFNDLGALSMALIDPDVCAFMVEPIQGEAGIVIPNEGYLREAKLLCTKRNVLFIADEIQSGLGRTGKLLCCDHDKIRPDILVLGKSLSGGMYPVSAALANDDVMLVVEPGTHGSTYGGNPLACKVALTALNVLIEEGMIENSEKMGRLLLCELQRLDSPFIKSVRGKGLFCAIVVNSDLIDAHEVSKKMASLGLISKPTHKNILRLSPPLIINEEQILQAVGIIQEALNSFKK